MPPENDLESARPWLEYAEGDLSAAETLRAANAEPYLVCFHCQQASEKAYKAYLVWLGGDPIPHIHDLALLVVRIRALGGETPPDVGR